MDDFTPQQGLINFLQYWWVVSLMAVAGGGVGWLLHEQRPPIFEAQARFHIAVDYTRAPELTEFQEDQAIAGAAAIIISTDIMDQVVADANAAGIDISLAELEQKYAMERRQAVWQLAIRDADPHTAMALANIWADRGLLALIETDSHAQRARALQAYADLLQACSQAEPPPEHLTRQCLQLDPENLSSELEETLAALGEAHVLSRGLFPELLFDLSERALLPEMPVRLGRNSLVLAGAAIGFLLGLGAVLSGWVVRIRQ